MGRRGQAAALFPLAVACVACLFANPRAQCRAAAATSASTSARKRLQSRSLTPPAGCWRLRGGGVEIEDNVTPQDIAEIGGDVLSMWHVSSQETGRNSPNPAFLVDGAKALISEELATSRPSARSSAGGLDQDQGPQTKGTGEESSAQDIRKLRMAAMEESERTQTTLPSSPAPAPAASAAASAAAQDGIEDASTALLPSIVTWNPLRWGGGDIRHPSGAMCGVHGEMDVSMSMERSTQSPTAMLPSVVTWSTPATPVGCGPLTEMAVAHGSAGGAEGGGDVGVKDASTTLLPSVVTWNPMRLGEGGGGGGAGVKEKAAGEREEEEHKVKEETEKKIERERVEKEEKEKRKQERREAEDRQLASLVTLKSHLGEAKTLVNELDQGRRAEAETQLAEMEQLLAQQQLAANQRLWDAASEGDLEDIRRIVLLGADLEAGDPELFGRTSVHFAAYHGQTGAVKELVKLGARLNATSIPLHFTALHYAAQRGHNETVAELIKMGADPHAVNDFGKSPAKLARLNGHAWLADWLVFRTKERADTLDSIAGSLRALGLSPSESTRQAAAELQKERLLKQAISNTTCTSHPGAVLETTKEPHDQTPGAGAPPPREVPFASEGGGGAEGGRGGGGGGGDGV